MFAPVIQKIISAPTAFVERQESRIIVQEGQKVEAYDFVAESATTADGRRHRVTAGVPGVVAKVLPGKAVLIRTSALIIRGVFGLGADTEGEVRVAATASEPIRKEDLSADDRGAILVGGHVPSLEVLKKAEALGVAGIVCGGVNRLRLNKSSLPLLVVDGFGNLFLNEDVFALLSKVEGRHVFLSPDRRELLVARHRSGKEDRPEAFAGYREEIKTYFAKVAVGDRVQVFSGWHFGRVGKVVRIKGDEVEVRIGRDTIKVPGRNVGSIK